MKNLTFCILCSFFSFTTLVAQNNVTYDPDANWLGYMNVFNLDGGYEFGSAWEVEAVSSVLSADSIELRANFNTYSENAGDSYWVNQTTGEGEKIMEGLTFVEPGAFFNGVDLTFSGTVIENTFGDDYSVKYFIKALNPNNDFADDLAGTGVFDLPSSGDFSVSITGESLIPGLVIQYGFSVTGRNANPNIEPQGSAIVGPSSLVSSKDLDSNAYKVDVFPNPTHDLLSIKADRKIDSYRISNLAGQILLEGTNVEGIDISNFVSGNYIIVTYSNERAHLTKFIKS